jgi:hypothetical protein
VRSSRIAVALAVVAVTAGIVIASAAVVAGAGAPVAASVPSFEPITIQRIDLPPNVTEASSPVFTLDGRHVLFFADQQLWIVGDDGSHPTCLSCGLPNPPTLSPSEQEGFATPFPDGKRVFFGAANSAAVLECQPSVDACLHRLLLPVDLSGARPAGGGAGPGGVDAATGPRWQ